MPVLYCPLIVGVVVNDGKYGMCGCLQTQGTESQTLQKFTREKKFQGKSTTG